MNLKSIVMSLVLAGCCSSLTFAQMGSSTPKIAPGTMVQPSKSFDASLGRFENEIMGVAKAMPADKYGFVPSAEIFTAKVTPKYDGVRSFASMVGHVAEWNYRYGTSLSGLKPEIDLKTLDRMTDKDQLIAALTASFAFAHRAMATLTEKNAFESVNGTQTRASVAAGLIGHGFDHYGQLVEYLRMNGFVPPASAQ